MMIKDLDARVIGGHIVELKGGLFVSTTAVVLALSLEAKGHTLTAKDGVLMVSNGATLTGDERAAITRHRMPLLTIAGYSAPS
jgi:hypothetical protein